MKYEEVISIIMDRKCISVYSVVFVYIMQVSLFEIRATSWKCTKLWANAILIGF